MGFRLGELTESVIGDHCLNHTRIMGKRYKTFEVYLVYIDADKCDGCEECVKMCPVNVFDMSHKAYPTRPENCLGCGTCVALCKSKAIIITEI